MIGIFGGTFDPIHHGHLRVALDVQEALALTQVRFIPLNDAVHRDAPLASGAQRLAMLQAATDDCAQLIADDRELRRGGASYTVDTLRDLRTEVGPETPLCLLLGDDAFNGLPHWRAPEQIMTLAHIVVMQRPGHQTADDAQLQSWINSRGSDDPAVLKQTPGGQIFFQPVTQLDISATDIRARTKAGRSARYLTPDTVLKVIAEQQLYQDTGS